MPFEKQLINRVTKAKTLLGVIAVSVFSLVVSCNAHAAIDEAIEAFKNQDGATMLAEVKEAMGQKNDDGLILFLSLLKEYPQSWQPVLSATQQGELFALLEKLAEESSLQAQYRLAIILREHASPRYNSPEALQEEQALLKRLEVIAGKGYSTAALHIFVLQPSISSPEYDLKNAMTWLQKSAEMGNAIAAFSLGMKYLNIMDDKFGCLTGSPHCPQKDEAKGWYWMQQAAMHVDKYDFIWAELAYQMGNLYRTGIDGQQPDLQQAYLWYHTATNGFGAHLVQNKIQSAIAKVLKGAVPNPEQVKPRLLGIKNDRHEETRPVFSLVSLSGTKSSLVLEVYEDGRLNLLLLKRWWQGSQVNTEIWKKVSSEKVEKFRKAFEELALSPKFKDSGGHLLSCDDLCPEATHNRISIRTDGVERSVVLINRSYNAFGAELAEVLTLVEQFFSMRKFLCKASNGNDEKHCLPIVEKSAKAMN